MLVFALVVNHGISRKAHDVFTFLELYWMLDFGEVLNVFDAFFQVADSVDENWKFGIQRYFPVDICLSVHKAAIWLRWDWLSFGIHFLLLSQLVFINDGLSLAQVKLFLAIVYFQLKFANDAVLSLTVGSAVQEQCSDKKRSLCFTVVSAILAFKLRDSVY